MLLLFEASFPADLADFPFDPKIYSSFLLGWSFLYFFLAIAAVPFLTSHKFWPNPTRLAFDTVVSITQTILAFAFTHRIYGIISPQGALSENVWDHVYFSTVTFSTFGYGDFRPSESARTLAGLQSIIGNLHLGMVVGVAFFAAQPGGPSPENTAQPRWPEPRRLRRTSRQRNRP